MPVNMGGVSVLLEPSPNRLWIVIYAVRVAVWSGLLASVAETLLFPSAAPALNSWRAHSSYIVGSSAWPHAPIGATGDDDYEVVANAHCVRGGDGLDGGFPGMAGAMQPPAFCRLCHFRIYRISHAHTITAR
jgi:hypothetical protein